LYRWKRGVPGCIGDGAMKRMKREGAHDVGVKNDLFNYMCVVRNKEVYAMLKIVVKIWRV
jgi:hypothetical protein